MSRTVVCGMVVSLLLVSATPALGIERHASEAGQETDDSDGLAWGIGIGETALFGTLGLLLYGGASDEWHELTTLLGLTVSCLGGAGLGVAAYVNKWEPWVGRALHGAGTGLGEVLILGAMAQPGGDDVWGRVTPKVWGMAGAFAVAAGTTSALAIDSYQEFLTVAAFQGAGLMLASLGGAGYKVASAMCRGRDCTSDSETTAIFMTVLVSGLLVGHITGLTWVALRSPEEATPASQPTTFWRNLHILPASPGMDGAGLTATLLW